ncbi:hypothetical protein HJG60_008572 [Phyllostomus discolor]|uniref:Uncharacterized protein n=1 Tax=Phyllostomus discolor TaxID=89673 RepID=A0A834DL81_9CHIR|nr:hypothetical protein HJG60_008572 [Phyllostomus discolor]
MILVKISAPNAEQMHPVNHLKGSPTEEKRSGLEESAGRAHGGPHGWQARTPASSMLSFYLERRGIEEQFHQGVAKERQCCRSFAPLWKESSHVRMHARARLCWKESSVSCCDFAPTFGSLWLCSWEGSLARTDKEAPFVQHRKSLVATGRGVVAREELGAINPT